LGDLQTPGIADSDFFPEPAPTKMDLGTDPTLGESQPSKAGGAP
jgi:hypothetical protein